MTPKILSTALFLFLAVFAMTNTVHAQDSDYAAIEKAVSYYLDGGTNNDFDTLKKAFHDNATMKYMRGGEYTEVNALEFFGSRMKPGPKSDRKTSIAAIDIFGDAANAKLVLEYEDQTLVDFMNLLKVDGEWKIVGKIFSRADR